MADEDNIERLAKEIEMPIVRRFQGERTELSMHDRIHLMNVVNMPGYGVIVRLCEMEARFFETQLLNTPAGEVENVRANHAKAQAVWQWFESLQSRIQDEINQHLNPEG